MRLKTLFELHRLLHVWPFHLHSRRGHSPPASRAERTASCRVRTSLGVPMMLGAIAIFAELAVAELRSSLSFLCSAGRSALTAATTPSGSSSIMRTYRRRPGHI